MKISIIVAVSQNNVIGAKGKLLWHIPQDLKNFRTITMGHHILMGRKTYESIGRVLPGRTSIILSSDKDFKAKGCFVFQNLAEALGFAEVRGEKELMVIGGGQIYGLTLPLAQKIYLTIVHKNYKGDVVFPALDKAKWREISKEPHLESDPPFEFITLSSL